MEQIYKDYVSYEEFGAKGDGVTDDIEAIKAAHEYANEHKVNVKSNPHATYYIGPRPITAFIKTNVDWNTSKFIIDDTNVLISERGASIFRVVSSYEPIEFSVPSLKKNQMKLDASFPSNCYVRVENSEKKQFIRYGLNQNNGSSQTDCFVVDSTGYILNPIIWDFEKVTKAVAYPIDETVLTISGGVFTTIANQAESKYNYHGRNINITRSNVVIEKLTHKVEGELDHGAPYAGFININLCAYVTVRDTFLSGRKIYSTIGSAGKPVSMGSYDLSIGNAVGIRFENVRQNGIMDRSRWGLMGTNHCRDLYFDNCLMSRFDAHENVVNLTIKNTTLGHQCFNAIGHGTMVVENVIAYGNSFLNLRSDYGSTWDGDIIFRNCTWYPASHNASPSFIGGSNSGGHDFGFPCYMPHNVTIENLRICDTCGPENYAGAQIFNVSERVMNGNGDIDYGDKTKMYPYFFSESLYMKNVVCDSGKGIKIFSEDTKNCYATQKNTAINGIVRPNFRATVENCQLASEGIVPETALSTDDYNDNYRLVPRVELRNCTNVVCKATNTPAVVKVIDCAVTDVQGGGACNLLIEAL